MYIITLGMSVSYFLVPHQSINRLAILDKSAMNSLVLLTTCVRCTVNHADVVLFIDFTHQFSVMTSLITATKLLQLLSFAYAVLI